MDKPKISVYHRVSNCKCVGALTSVRDCITLLDKFYSFTLTRTSSKKIARMEELPYVTAYLALALSVSLMSTNQRQSNLMYIMNTRPTYT